MKRLPIGKLPTPLLGALLAKRPCRDARVVIGPGIGLDAAAIDFGSSVLVAKSDPITFTRANQAWYAVHVNANDVACAGARPRWFLATLLLPETARAEDAEGMFGELSAALAELDIELVGGHTEVTAGLDRALVAGTMLGEVRREQLIDNRRVRPGDDLVLIKGIAIEGTAILAREKASELSSRFSEAWLTQARGYLRRPGISVVREATRVTQVIKPHAMHDPTEGGLVGALRELAAAGRVGIRLFGDNVNVYPETEALAAEFGLDPLGLIASGALLVATAPHETDLLLEAIRDDGTEAFVIGKALAPDEGLILEERGRRGPMPEFPVDEITRVLGGN